MAWFATVWFATAWDVWRAVRPVRTVRVRTLGRTGGVHLRG